MSAALKQQIVMSGVGGQGILFVTRILAEAAICKGLPILTSETHGMAQRGGTVLSHIKAGGYFSPLIRPAQADGLILLKEENLAQHRFYLKPGGWIVLNTSSPSGTFPDPGIHCIDADRLAASIGNHQSLNLIMLGFTAARCEGSLFCSSEEIGVVLRARLAKKEALLSAALEALELGMRHGKR